MYCSIGASWPVPGGLSSCTLFFLAARDNRWSEFRREHRERHAGNETGRPTKLILAQAVPRAFPTDLVVQHETRWCTTSLSFYQADRRASSRSRTYSQVGATCSQSRIFTLHAETRTVWAAFACGSAGLGHIWAICDTHGPPAHGRTTLDGWYAPCPLFRILTDQNALSSAGAILPIINHGLPMTSKGYLIPKSGPGASHEDAAVVCCGLMMQRIAAVIV